MPSVMVSGDSSEATSSKTTGGENNPIELGDSSTNGGSDTESENENDTSPELRIVKVESGCNEEGEEGGGENEINRNDDNGEEKANDDIGENGDQKQSEGNGGDEMDVDGDQGAAKSSEDNALEKQDKGDDGDNDGNNSEDASAKALRQAKRMKVLWGNIESMSEIKKSPYEGNECAEVGEGCFEELRLLMHCSETDGTMSPRMVALVGDKLARDLCNAHHEIGKSGMLYSANWKEGKIRDSDFGWIPKRQLLLCLHEHRFAKGGEVVLQAVTKNLDCTKLVLEAMRLWDLMDAYPNLASNKNEETFAFGLQKVCCYKCQIFVARAFATLQILNKTEGIEQSLTKKIKACLSIMNEYVRVNQIELARMTKKAQKRKAFETPCLDEPEAVRSKSPRSRKSENSGSQTKAAPSRGPKPRGPRNSANAPEKETRKRRRKIPKREEREESIFMLFNTMHMQVQRLNQMMSFFQSQLQDHRGILRDEIKENLGNGNTKE